MHNFWTSLVAQEMAKGVCMMIAVLTVYHNSPLTLRELLGLAK